MRHFVPGMIARGGGRIVNLVDAALASPRDLFAPYLASKAALVTLTQSLAREFAPHVQVNAVAPGAILPPAGASEGTAERLIARVPAGRLGTTAEIADTVMFLVTGPSYVTGQVIAVAGGN